MKPFLIGCVVIALAIVVPWGIGRIVAAIDLTRHDWNDSWNLGALMLFALGIAIGVAWVVGYLVGNLLGWV